VPASPGVQVWHQVMDNHRFRSRRTQRKELPSQVRQPDCGHQEQRRERRPHGLIVRPQCTLAATLNAFVSVPSSS
jgi:hypothetical protein